MLNCLGQRYGRLLIQSQWVEERKSFVYAQCDCGILKKYCLNDLRRGSTQSCGCYRDEFRILNKTTHGKSKTSAYLSWSGMIQRCTNPKNSNFKNYGARGITVCKRWLKFENFCEDVGERPGGLTLDRVDNSKGYSKENCRWTTPLENNRNRRDSRYWFIKDKRFDSSRAAAREFGVSFKTIQNWCNGFIRNSTGVRYPAKPGCYSELKYKESLCRR